MVIFFWSSVKKENYFFHNFTFNSLDGDEIEKTVSQSFIKLALQELKKIMLLFFLFVNII